MTITRIIDAVGKSLLVPIDGNDQSVGLTFTGEYVGMFQIIGIIETGGPEIEITAYDHRGDEKDINDPSPFNVFVDIGGFKEIWLIAVAWTSGSAWISATKSTAPRFGSNNQGKDSGRLSSEVQVTNFPSNQAVTGPLTNVQLRASPVIISIPEQPLPDGAASEQTLSNFLQMTRGKDTGGELLPLDFGSLPSSFTYSGELLQTEVRVHETFTYTRTYFYTDERLTSISGWVKT